MNKKIALIILDGYGISNQKYGNAIAMAKTPTLDYLFKNFPNTQLEASGLAVGLPANQMGNSEIGHMNIGCGRVINGSLNEINNQLNSNEGIERLDKISSLIKKNHSKVHLIGLFSTGGVHSHLNHTIELIKYFQKNDISVIIHCISDGRDTSPKQFIKDIDKLLKITNEKIIIGSISGRYYAMDRDCRWDRTLLSYEAMIGKTNNMFSNLKKYISNNYKNGITDEFIIPAKNESFKNQEIINDNDVVFFTNFRSDRSRQLTHLFKKTNIFSYEKKLFDKNIFLATMTKYENIDSDFVFLKETNYKNVFGEILSKNKFNQVRIAETEKYPHVTFFFDGGKEIKYQGETKIFIPSPKVKTYDKKPAMSAKLITNSIIENMNNKIIIANYANLDMVGHTGNLKSTIKAVEFIDQCLKKVYQAAIKNNYVLFITSDHGNAELMLGKNNEIITKHSTNNVPFIVTDKNVKLYQKVMKLANIAPTILKYLNIPIPKQMVKETIIK